MINTSPSMILTPPFFHLLACPAECTKIATHSFQTWQILIPHALLTLAIQGCHSVREVMGWQTWYLHVLPLIDKLLYNTSRYQQKVTKSDKKLKHATEVLELTYLGKYFVCVNAK